MEAFATQSTDEVMNLRNGLPEKVAQLNNSIATLFPYKNLVDVEAVFSDTINKALPNSGTNDAVTKILQHTRQELADGVDIMRSFARWITLMIPVIEDGNNFGVGVQGEVLKAIKEKQAHLQGLFGALPGYYKDRAAAWKVLDMGNKSTSKVTKEESEGDEKPKKSVSTTETSTSNPSLLPDGIAHIVSLDVQTYYHLKATLEDLRDVYIAVGDCVEKNLSKIQFPKGKSGSMSSAMSMY